MTKISKSKYLNVSSYIVDEEYENTRLDNCLISKLKNLPRSKIYSIIRKGEVRINGSRSKPDRRLKKGDVIRIPPYRVEERGQNTASKSLTELLKDRIIYNKNSVLIFNKVPKKYSIEKSLIENWINKSIEKAKLNNVRGKDVTPFLETWNRLATKIVFGAFLGTILINFGLNSEQFGMDFSTF